MKKAAVQTVNEKDARVQTKEQSRVNNPYSPPTTTKPNASKSPAGNNQSLFHSPPTCPPFSPPFSEFSPSPYSPTNASAPSKKVSSVTPPQPPVTTIIPASLPVTPARSFNRNFTYPTSNDNSSAGHTPYNPDVKRKLDFGAKKQIVRSVKKMKLLSHTLNQTQNKLFYTLLPDGIVCAYACKGTPNGPPGFLQPALRSISEALQASSETELVHDIEVTSILPLKCPRTNQARQILYSNGTKKMKFCCLIFVRDNVSDNTSLNGDAWCTNLVRKFSRHFPDMTLTFGGNAANFGVIPPSSLELFFLTEDVANLAMLAYEDSIRDYSFFSNPELVNMYFNDASTAFTIFRNMFHI